MKPYESVVLLYKVKHKKKSWTCRTYPKWSNIAATEVVREGGEAEQL